MFDFCISILGLQHDRKKWNAVKEYIEWLEYLYCLRSTTIEVCPRLVMRQPLDLDRALNHEKQ
jgi:hypothetical protein